MTCPRLRGSGRVAISVAVLLVACQSPERFPGEGLIAGFERKQHWLTVFGGHGATLFQLVDMRQFGDFTPGQVPEATGIAVGRPDSVRTDRSARYFVYRRKQGVFEVGAEQYADGDHVRESHPLYYYPADRRPESFLSPSIVRHLKPNAEQETVQIFECGAYQPGLVVVMKRGQIEEIIWTEITELTLRPRSDQCTPWG